MMPKANIAIVGYSPLGDNYVLLVVAHNLQQSGYAVTFFSDKLCELDRWFPNIRIQPYPRDHYQTALNSFDLVFMTTNNAIISNHPDDIPLIANNYVVISTGSFSAFKEHDLQQVRNKFKGQAPLETLANASGLKLNSLNTATMVDNCVFLCRNILKLNKVSRTNGISSPADFSWKKHSRRILISPTASRSKKVWPAKKFIRVAQALSKKNLEVVFIAAPHEKAGFQTELDNYHCSLPLLSFHHLDELATYLYESALLIGNNSSNGHLASALGIPTVIIPASKRLNAWQPAWAENIMVRYWLPRNLLGRYLWKSLISVAQVCRATLKLLADSPPVATQYD